MEVMCNCIQKIEAEKQKIRYQAKRLFQENAWLRDVLTTTQESYRQSELKIIQLEEQIKNLQFNSEMSKYNVNDSVDSSGICDGDSTVKTAANLGFPSDDRDDQDQYGGRYIESVLNFTIFIKLYILMLLIITVDY